LHDHVDTMGLADAAETHDVYMIMHPARSAERAAARATHARQLGRSVMAVDRGHPPAQVAAAKRQLEIETARENTLHGWWIVAAWVTGLLGLPIGFALVESIGCAVP